MMFIGAKNMFRKFQYVLTSRENHVNVHVSGVRLCLWTAATIWPVVHPPDHIWVWRATVEWFAQGKTKELGEKPVLVPLCPRQIPHGLTWVRIWASTVRGQRLAAWTVARAREDLTQGDVAQDLLACGLHNMQEYVICISHWYSIRILSAHYSSCVLSLIKFKIAVYIASALNHVSPDRLQPANKLN
jgi:hypothetical protein